MTDAPTKLDKLKAKKAELEAQIRSMHARETAKQRKADARRKIELGGLVLKAGLGQHDKGELLGGLLALASQLGSDANAKAAYKRAGDAALAGKK